MTSTEDTCDCPPTPLTVDTSDPETKAIYDTAQLARAEVDRWPEWKRGTTASSECRHGFKSGCQHGCRR